MFLTEGFIHKLKTFLMTIEYPYSDKYHPEMVEKLVYELIPRCILVEDVHKLMKDYKFFRNRPYRVMKIFNTPKHLQVYRDFQPDDKGSSFLNDDEAYGQVVISNSLLKGFMPYTKFQVFSTIENRTYEIIKSGKHFYLNNSDYKITTFFSRVELYHRDDLIAKYSMSFWGKRCRLKLHILNGYVLEQDESSFNLYRLNFDQEKELLGIIVIKEVLEITAGGFAFIKVSDESAYDFMVMLSLGMLFSMIYAENSSRSS